MSIYIGCKKLSSQPQGGCTGRSPTRNSDLAAQSRPPHPFTAIDAGHLDGGLKAGTGRRWPGDLRHRVLEFQRGNATLLGPTSPHSICPIPDAIGTSFAKSLAQKFSSSRRCRIPAGGRTNRRPRRDPDGQQVRGQTPRSRWISCLDRRQL